MAFPGALGAGPGAGAGGGGAVRGQRLALLVLALGAVARLSPASAKEAAPKAPQKLDVPTKAQTAQVLRLEGECHGCFPNSRESCSSQELWNRCCQQEVNCHEHHCRSEVLGELQANTKVRIRVPFTSDDEAEAPLAKGMHGRVVRVDGDGMALVKFWRDDYDEAIHKHWVSRRNCWDNLELPERPVRMRASRVVGCMDNCTVSLNCRMNELSQSKRGLKKIQACFQQCKFEECETEPECKGYADAYSMCKQKVAGDGHCSPQPSASSKEAEL